MKKTMKALLAMVLAVILVLSAIPASAAETRSVSSNFDAVVSHIKNHPESFVNDDGNKMFGYIIDVGYGTATLTLEAQSSGILFALYMDLAEDGQQAQVWGEFLLRKYYDTVNTDFYALMLENGEAVDYIEDTVSFDRRQHTAESEYQVSGSEYGYISAEDASVTFNMVLQTSCMFWNTYFLENLDFGLDGLGFDKYECPHSYDHDCDTTCNLCGEKRKTEHTYGPWEWLDEDSHIAHCVNCDSPRQSSHKWTVVEIHKMPTAEENGLISYICHDCGTETTMEIVYSPADYDSNGLVNNYDVEYLLWHTLFPQEYLLVSDGDLNHDDVVNNLDVEYLLWHTLFPEDYPIV